MTDSEISALLCAARSFTPAQAIVVRKWIVEPADRHLRQKRYAQFLNSPYWRSASAIFRALREMCEVCKTEKSTQVHHLSYKNLGRERDEDLQAVCAGCHTDHHKQKVVEPGVKIIRHVRRVKGRKRPKGMSRRKWRRLRESGIRTVVMVETRRPETYQKPSIAPRRCSTPGCNQWIWGLECANCA